MEEIGIKRYDIPKTSYQRVIESPHAVESVKQKLKTQMASLDPFTLRQAIEEKLKVIFKISSISMSQSTSLQ
jgi:hypothetical protein